MKAGEYIRTPYGDIGKITSIPKHNKYFDDGFEIEHKFIECGKDAMKKLKSTPNIIDLIGVGDLLIIDICPDLSSGIAVPRVAETEYELDIFKKWFKSGEYILRGIVPKEKIESMTYWVGD